MQLEKYSFGIGDRFSQQGTAQLKAIRKADSAGIPLVPVWNKSNREHQTIHSSPADTRKEADRAVADLGWEKSYYVDADHINKGTVDPFLDHSNFFTIDVAEFIGKAAGKAETEQFLHIAGRYTGTLNIPGIQETFEITADSLSGIASSFLGAVKEAASIYSYIASGKDPESFIAEISMDEVESAQSPVDLFFILLMIHMYNIPVQTIAPKFTGRFNKGVDYEGSLEQFKQEFEQDLQVIQFAVREFELPSNLKLSVHSGSDKFSIYPLMGELIRKHDAGIHVKTAGTTWLEEVIGLALASGESLEMAKNIYSRAFRRREELCGPYATVIDIQPELLPSIEEVNQWSGDKFADTLRHIPGHPEYNPGFRQLIHVGYKIAAELGDSYIQMLHKYRSVVEEQVTTNLYERHIKRLFSI